MIDKNWLKKTAHPGDKRSYLLSLSTEGKVLGEFVTRAQSDVHKKMQENLTVEELQEFARAAGIISANLQAYRVK